jgi:predicted nucleic acid-binding protein
MNPGASYEDPQSFVDTNILVYAFANNDEKRSPASRLLLDELWAAKAFRTSTQVLQETYSVLTTKLQPRMASHQVLFYLDRLVEWPVVTIEYAMIRAAVELSEGAQIQFWDALIVVAAFRASAKRLYTEDLNHGQVLMGVEIINPFRAGSKHH